MNTGHPFREGNGRTTRIFMEHVSRQSPFTLNFSEFLARPSQARAWNAACAASYALPNGSVHVDPSLRGIFAHIAHDRPAARAPLGTHAALFPQAAQAAGVAPSYAPRAQPAATQNRGITLER